MEKKAHKYQVTLTYLETAKGEPAGKQPIEVEFSDHDDISPIIERLQAKDPFDNKNEEIEFAIGLKMFSEVIIKTEGIFYLKNCHPLLASL